MNLIKSCISAFLMYSAIPMPQIEWKEENRRFSLCFFPLIGAVIGGLLWVWFLLYNALGFGKILFSVIAAVLPVCVTGGIHLDGFCDVCDAKACLGSREKVFEVMKDPRIGSFAAIKLAEYFLIQAGFFSEIGTQSVLLICSSAFVMSRAWSGLAAVTFPCAKKNGTLHDFINPAHKKITVAALALILVMSAVFAVCLNPPRGCCAVLAGAASMAYYRYFADKRFGGITGDLAGYFLQICELSAIGAAVVCDIILGVI